MYFLLEAVSARGLFFKWTILISVIMDAMVLCAIAYRLWVFETAGLCGGIAGAGYLTLNSLNIMHTTIDHC